MNFDHKQRNSETIVEDGQSSSANLHNSQHLTAETDENFKLSSENSQQRKNSEQRKESARTAEDNGAFISTSPHSVDVSQARLEHSSVSPGSPPLSQMTTSSSLSRMPWALSSWDVNIPDVVLQEEADGKRRALYHIACTYNEHQWDVWRRYNDFVELHQHRVQEAFAGSDEVSLPAFPEKSFWESLFGLDNSEEKTRQRQWQLESYLKCLVTDPRLVRVRSSVHQFLRERPSDRTISPEKHNALVLKRDQVAPKRTEGDLVHANGNQRPDVEREREREQIQASRVSDRENIELPAADRGRRAHSAHRSRRRRGTGAAMRENYAVPPASVARGNYNLLLSPPPRMLSIPRVWEFSDGNGTIFPDSLLEELNDCLEFLSSVQHRLLGSSLAAEKLKLLEEQKERISATENALIEHVKTLSNLLRDPLLQEVNAELCRYFQFCLTHLDVALDWLEQLHTTTEPGLVDLLGAENHRSPPVSSATLQRTDEDYAATAAAVAAAYAEDPALASMDLTGEEQERLRANIMTDMYGISLPERVRLLEQRADELAIEIVAGDTPLCCDPMVDSVDRPVQDFNAVAKLEESAHALRQDAAQCLLDWRKEAERELRAGDASAGHFSSSAEEVSARLEEVIDQCNDLLRLLRESRATGSTRVPEQRISEYESQLYTLLNEAQTIDDRSAPSRSNAPEPTTALHSYVPSEASEPAEPLPLDALAEVRRAYALADAARLSEQQAGLAPRVVGHNAQSDLLFARTEKKARSSPNLIALDADDDSDEKEAPVEWPSEVSSQHIRDVKERLDTLIQGMATYRRTLEKYLTEEDHRVTMQEYARKERMLRRERLNRTSVESSPAKQEREQVRNAAQEHAVYEKQREESRLSRQHLLDRLEDLQENAQEFHYQFTKRFAEHLPDRSLYNSIVGNPLHSRQIVERRVQHQQNENEMFGL